LVVDPDHVEAARALTESQAVRTSVMTGGATRRESVFRAIEAMPADIVLVAVHDAVRPFWPISTWDNLVDACAQCDGAILASPVTDTMKRYVGTQTATVDRRDLWMAQTPQVFRADKLRDAHQRAAQDGFEATDDAELVERIGGRVAIVSSTAANIKVTTPEDWILAAQIAGATVSSAAMRVGIGYDTHRLGGDRPLVLGGVRFADTGGLIGYSDGDALLHAICDALLGAVALGDIGVHFPPGDPRFAGVDSIALVKETVAILQRAGYRAVQMDATVLAEHPKIMPQADAMRRTIADALGIGVGMVSIKATTNEGMGFVGRGEGIAAQAIATVAPVGR
jgi:2-C-methyl-D-erythritol 4-phosphate cytidylyltransferase/2-C-methyl-D-erythritol 2,4-cyclodiphosphate synthase